MSIENEVKLTIKVTPVQVMIAIREYLKLPPDTVIWFDIEEKWEGYGTAEHKVTEFNGATASFKKPLKEVL